MDESKGVDDSTGIDEASPVVGVEASDTVASASTSSISSTLQPENAAIMLLCQDMFKKISDYVAGEFDSVADDYRLLEQMNSVTLTKYAEMKDISANLTKTMSDLKEKYNSLQPYLEMIDQVEESVASLEQAAYKIDSYSKRLEAKFKMLEKK